MNKELKIAVADLISVKEEMQLDLAAFTKNEVARNSFIDLTIARVLGGDDNNNNSSDTPRFQKDHSFQGEEKEKNNKTASATPISSNKKSRLLCYMLNITTLQQRRRKLQPLRRRRHTAKLKPNSSDFPFQHGIERMSKGLHFLTKPMGVIAIYYLKKTTKFDGQVY